MANIFKIKQGYSSITIEKNGSKFNIEKSSDGDIWFDSLNDMELQISFNSTNQEEWQSYVILERLMKLIIDKYVLNEDKKYEYSYMPKDFVDIENKTIIWHSDSENENILKLQLNQNEITISILKDKNVNNRNSNNTIRVRIRTNGSDYGDYYQEFEYFFNELSSFSQQVESIKKQNIPKDESQSVLQKRLSLFSKFKK